MTCMLFEWWKHPTLVTSVFEEQSCEHADAVETSVILAAKLELAHKDRFENLTSSSKWGREIEALYLPSRTDQFSSS
ncbi:MAG: hypothetical protein KAU62_11855 [Candidatus Heimdallarchaeota archaeon]|nr:creatininase family protein [Candidatus Heimdallarchaeota archaeon]MCG3256778.1 hypothetical protein [Candidatus Heimdallarchaeota archaeon]MCK4611841.1 hypothetical protein [Candidatus Heimdallarchaeota archaeon]